MTERPILFSAPMVRALLSGTKTQTRRVVKLKSHHTIEQRDDGRDWPWMYDGERDADSWLACPYGQPGDRLWVRETFWIDRDGVFYKADQESGSPWLAAGAYKAMRVGANGTPYVSNWGWRPSIHMPRAASRIALEVTGVRVERLQDISETDAQAEGAEYGFDCESGFCLHPLGNYRHGYAYLWESINGPGSWESNPWVWAVEFKRLEA